MTMILALLLTLTQASTAQAAGQDFLVMDPERVECRVLPGAEIRSMRCDVFYSGKIVHEGRSMSETVANGDCVKCETVLEDAKSLAKKVRMYRGYYGSDLADWHMQNFFVVNQPDSCEQLRR